MRHLPMRLRSAVLVAIVVLPFAAPSTAVAAIDVTRDTATGGLRIVSTADAIEAVTIERASADVLRVREDAGPTGSSDGACAPDEAGAGSVLCEAPTGSAVAVSLGAGNDRLDARAATGVALTVDGGAGADVLRVGASGLVRMVDATATDTVDLSHAASAVRARYHGTSSRMVARCAGCSPAWSVTLPISPGRVVTGAFDDDVDLGSWRRAGRTTWMLGDGRDRFFGSPTRRSTVNAGAGWDTLVSRAAVDVLRGGPGLDRMADFGGRGDLLSGGPETDLIASLDGKRDMIDGQAGRDMCLGVKLPVRTCDSGPVRNVESSRKLPLPTQRNVLLMLGIS